MLPAFAHVRCNSELAALVSGSHDKLKMINKQYGIPLPLLYQQYSDCLQSGEIDAVYIALPERHAGE